MKLGNVYKHKKYNNLIQIDCFASHINCFTNQTENKDSVIVYANLITKGNIYQIGGSCPSFNGYGTVAEIEEEYELYIDESDLRKLSDEEYLELLTRFND